VTSTRASTRVTIFFEIACVLVCFDHVASRIVNANHSASLAVEFRISDCVADCVWLAVPQATEWQRIGNEIKAAAIFARADFVDVHTER
jgi:hypothetical protein